MIDAVATPPETPVEPARGNRVWRMVMIVATFQLVIIALGMVFFTAMGFANEPTGGCGGV